MKTTQAFSCLLLSAFISYSHATRAGVLTGIRVTEAVVDAEKAHKIAEAMRGMENVGKTGESVARLSEALASLNADARKALYRRLMTESHVSSGDIEKLESAAGGALKPEEIASLNKEAGITVVSGNPSGQAQGTHLEGTVSKDSNGTVRINQNMKFGEQMGEVTKAPRSQAAPQVRIKGLSDPEAVRIAIRNGGDKKILSVGGFSGRGYQDRAKLDAAIREMLNGKDPKQWIISAGVTDDGIGEVYKIAKEQGFETAGILATSLEEFSEVGKTPNVDRVILVNEPKTYGGLSSEFTSKYGGDANRALREGAQNIRLSSLNPTSRCYIGAADEVTFIGGGQAGAAEYMAAVNEAKQNGKKVNFIPLEAGKYKPEVTTQEVWARQTAQHPDVSAVSYETTADGKVRVSGGNLDGVSFASMDEAHDAMASVNQRRAAADTEAAAHAPAPSEWEALANRMGNGDDVMGPGKDAYDRAVKEAKAAGKKPTDSDIDQWLDAAQKRHLDGMFGGGR